MRNSSRPHKIRHSAEQISLTSQLGRLLQPMQQKGQATKNATFLQHSQFPWGAAFRAYVPPQGLEPTPGLTSLRPHRGWCSDPTQSTWDIDLSRKISHSQAHFFPGFLGVLAIADGTRCNEHQQFGSRTLIIHTTE